MEIWRFENTEMFWLLSTIPLLGILWFGYLIFRKSRIKKIGDPELVRQLIQYKERKLIPFRIFIISLVIVFTVLGLANFQLGAETKTVQQKGSDIVIALDLSRSMMAEDVLPSRLESALQLISNMFEELKGDRVAIVVFAGNAYLQMPLSSDYSAAKLLLQSLSTGIIPTQGTAIEDAIEKSVKALEASKEENARIVLLLSDGESHEGELENAISLANENNIKVLSVGIGSTDGSTIPYKNDYLRDKEGKVVFTKLDPYSLQRLSDETDGSYFNLISAKKTSREIIETLDQQNKADLESRIFTDYNDYFQYFLAVALILLFVEFLIVKWRP